MNCFIIFSIISHNSLSNLYKIKSMRNIFIHVFLLILFIAGCNKSNELLTIKVKTASQNDEVSAKYTIEKWDKNTKLISISFTNEGDKTAYIKDVFVQFNLSPEFDENSRFLYGGSDMGRTPIQQCEYNDVTIINRNGYVSKK